MEAIILAYNIEGQELKKLKGICQKKNIRLRSVKPEEFGEKLGSFCGEAKKTGAMPAVMEDKMLVLCHFGDKQIDMMLAEMRTARICRDALMAALTPTNAQWNAEQQLTEMKREQLGSRIQFM